MWENDYDDYEMNDDGSYDWDIDYGDAWDEDTGWNEDYEDFEDDWCMPGDPACDASMCPDDDPYCLDDMGDMGGDCNCDPNDDSCFCDDEFYDDQDYDDEYG